MADVPVGLLLSGGLDSSIIAAMARRHGPLLTITMAFDGSGVNELPFARTVAKHIGSEHYEVEIKASEILDDIEAVVWHFDDLFADWGMASTRLLYAKCRDQGVKVVLVGEGADELFAGYPIFRQAIEVRGPRILKLFQLYRRYASRRYGSTFGQYRSVMEEYLVETNGNMFEAVRRFESKGQLPNNYVMKVDKASMSVSVEARAPFLDRRIADIAFQAPASELITPDGNKMLLRRMAERHALLPAETTHREKFGASMAVSWMDESAEFRAKAKEIVLSHDGMTDALGLRPAMTDYFERGQVGYRFPHALSIFNPVAWRLLLLNTWARRYLA